MGLRAVYFKPKKVFKRFDYNQKQEKFIPWQLTCPSVVSNILSSFLATTLNTMRSDHLQRTCLLSFAIWILPFFDHLQLFQLLRLLLSWHPSQLWNGASNSTQMEKHTFLNQWLIFILTSDSLSVSTTKMTEALNLWDCFFPKSFGPQSQDME